MTMTTEKKSPFVSISENLPFWPDRTTPKEQLTPFTGVLIDDGIILGDDPDPAKNVPVYVFADIETGEKFFIIRSYAIDKAVKTVKAKGLNIDETVFHFIFKGKTEANGKPFNQFDTAYCSIKEYEAAKEAVTETKKKK